MEAEKKSPLQFIIILLLVAIGFGLYIVFDRHEKRINSIVVADSLRTLKLERRFYVQDSTAKELHKRDSIQISNFFKLNNRFEKTKKSFDSLRDSIGVWPDL